MKKLYIDIQEGVMLIEMPEDIREESKFRKFLFERFPADKPLIIRDEKDNEIERLTLSELYGN
jgi:hypothetical protein